MIFLGSFEFLLSLLAHSLHLTLCTCDNKDNVFLEVYTGVFHGDTHSVISVRKWMAPQKCWYTLNVCCSGILSLRITGMILTMDK
jgi:hypothetical protein